MWRARSPSLLVVFQFHRCRKHSGETYGPENRPCRNNINTPCQHREREREGGRGESLLKPPVWPDRTRRFVLVSWWLDFVSWSTKGTRDVCTSWQVEESLQRNRLLAQYPISDEIMGDHPGTHACAVSHLFAGCVYNSVYSWYRSTGVGSNRSYTRRGTTRWDTPAYRGMDRPDRHMQISTKH